MGQERASFVRAKGKDRCVSCSVGSHRWGGDGYIFKRGL